MQQLARPEPQRRRVSSVTRRLMQLDWKAIEQGLWQRAYGKTSAVLDGAQCDRLVDLYTDDTRFRSRVEMARYRFGMGEYKYFANPLPDLVQQIRVEVYRHLVSTANQWNEAQGSTQRYPPDLGAFLEICARQGQPKPSPLLLRYHEGDYNCLHQDILGDVAFPFQVTCVLSRRNIDYRGGEFILVEQRRGQSCAEVVTLEQGELVIFATDRRPVMGKRGYRSAHLRHGISRVKSGCRFSLGVILHNSK